MAPSGDSSRLRHGLTPLSTSQAAVDQPASAPMTVSHSHSQQGIGGLIQPYNPQEWASPPASTPTPPPDRSRHADADSQASAPPPPPYSPPRTRRPRPVSTAFEYAIPLATSPPARSTPIQLRPSPEPQAIPGFLPPPEAPRRGGSRERRFGLPSLGRRPDNDRSSGFLDQQLPTRLGPFHRRNRYSTVIPVSSTVPIRVGARHAAASAATRASAARLGIVSLGPVPPTPADWVPDDLEPCRPDRGRPSGLTIDTRVATSSKDVPDPQLSSPGSGGLLSRAGAVRLDKTIIQRRAESRVRNSSSPRPSVDAIIGSRISDMSVVTGTDGSGPLTTRSNPRSGGARPQAVMIRAGELSASSSRQLDSRNSTPRALKSAELPIPGASTPPFSPMPASAAPKALPTPPPQVRCGSSSRPNEGSTRDKAPASQHVLLSQSPEQFAAAAVDRFRVFAAKEADAINDAERVRMFADFIVSESRIRRERYSSAIGAMGSEILDLTRDLFRPMTTTSSTTRRRGSWGNWTPDSSADLITSPYGVASALSGDGLSSSAPASAKLPATPKDDQPPNSGNNANRAMNYMPCLSPILSMSVSDNHENGSSRGRPSSRWWESDFQGDQRCVFERSRRESKYMGVSKDQWAKEEHGATTLGAPAGLQDDAGPAPDYPMEKTGWNDDEHHQSESAEAPRAPVRRTESLDVSRLVTLPPPYPRHYPAVNNNHPDLAAIRSSVRLLSDLTAVSEARERFVMANSKRRDEFDAAVRERQKSLRANLQEEILAGNLGYSDAAVIESDWQEQEKEKEKELGKTEYEKFQNEVVLPLNELLTGRIARATDMFEHLSRHLFEMDADMPQEEGDDRPELLEKLTLLKWIFEMRETLHRAIYDVLSDRNRRYCEVVEAPYRLTGNAEKLQSASAFFAQDAASRAHKFANEMLARTRQLQTVVEEAVERGVALQLSAFWDIAPPLRQLLDSIPDELEGFGVQVPASELEENPSYYAHPLQYLYSLLQHAEKSTHQFIESHTNLLCLLHEVKGAVVKAQARTWATKTTTTTTTTQDEDDDDVEDEDREQRAETMRRREDRRLTEDLKDKVREVQDQWSSALGEGIESVKERIGAWLLQRGGWDEALEESAGFGGV
ncbi:hypothetical protein CDD80_2538 [Ophiocordyceps camponoti-rufipedis]|uniref:Uncharacterized protein n=1 Tax=Ophiocordyceps camponoti-rufipedis TaxID=2004952 RepID=A0A2C5YAV9_9HYPO|nr:hypothetical protein CDD80_2538 [Ophiocordyceps camponoti-rufipedis]